MAFTILGLAAGAVLSIFGSGPSKISRAENKRMAVLAAESVLSQVGNERPIETGQWQGQLSPEVQWKLSMEPYSDSNNNNELGQTPIVQPYLVKVHTSAGAVWNASTADVETIRLKTVTP